MAIKEKGNSTPKASKKRVAAKNEPLKRTLLKLITDTLDQLKFCYETNDKQPVVHLSLCGTNIDLRLFIYYNEEQEWIRCFAVSPAKVPEDKREVALRQINRLNQEFATGCLRMDESDGEISAAMFINTDGGMVNESIVAGALNCCITLTDNTFPRLMKAIYGDDIAEVLAKQWTEGKEKN